MDNTFNKGKTLKLSESEKKIISSYRNPNVKISHEDIPITSENDVFVNTTITEKSK